MAVETARINEFKNLEQLRKEADQNHKEQLKAFQAAEQDPKKEAQALELYKKQIGFVAKLKKAEQKDQIYQKIKIMLAKEKESYTSIGNAILAANLDGPLLTSYFELIQLNDGFITLKEGKLSVNDNSGDQSKRDALNKQIEKMLNEKIEAVEKEKIAAEGRIASPEKDSVLHEMKGRLTSYNKVKEEFLADRKKLKHSGRKRSRI